MTKIGDGGKEPGKARRAARGFKDTLKLVYRQETAAPAVSQNARTLALQLMASHQWQMQIGDIRGAFMEADKLQRHAGVLYARQSPSGRRGPRADQTVELLLPLHGLDAPGRWFNKTSSCFKGMENDVQHSWGQSQIGPCLFYGRDRGLRGVLTVHVVEMGQSPRRH